MQPLCSLCQLCCSALMDLPQSSQMHHLILQRLPMWVQVGSQHPEGCSSYLQLSRLQLLLQKLRL